MSMNHEYEKTLIFVKIGKKHYFLSNKMNIYAVKPGPDIGHLKTDIFRQNYEDFHTKYT